MSATPRYAIRPGAARTAGAGFGAVLPRILLTFAPTDWAAAAPTFAAAFCCAGVAFGAVDEVVTVCAVAAVFGAVFGLGRVAGFGGVAGFGSASAPWTGPRWEGARSCR